MYNYIKNQYLLNAFTKENLLTLQEKELLTEIQRIEIIRVLEPDYTE